VYTGIVSPLDVVDRRAVLCVIGSVVEVVVLAHKSYRKLPLPSLLSPIRVGVVPEVLVESRSDVEETAVGDGVLVVVSVVEGEDLPPQTSAACRLVPALVLCVEDGLSKREPRGLPISKIGQFVLRRGHGGHSPESLIVVSERLGLVVGHEGVVGAHLSLHGLCGDLVVRVVARVVPVVNEGIEHGTAFPPVVWIRKVAGRVAYIVTGVVLS
jgi:hypothetical protein